MAHRTLLSLDLGVTTGWAVFDIESKELEAHGVLEYPPEEPLKALIAEHTPARSVAERAQIVRGSLGDALYHVHRVTERLLMRQVDIIDPARWKQTPWAKAKVPRGISQHERDAIRIGLWYLNTILT